MVSCFFRYIKDGNVSDVGFVLAKDGKDLFWKIDEFFVPYEVEVKKSGDGFYVSSQIKRKRGVVGAGEPEFDFNSFNGLMGANGWVKPKITEDCEMILPWNLSHE